MSAASRSGAGRMGGILLGLAALSLRASAPAHDGASAAAKPASPAWGLYHIYWGRDYEQRLRDRLVAFATRPAYVMFYRDLGRGFPHQGVRAIRAVGATPVISLELWRWGDRETRYLPKIEAGEFDDAFRAWARAARAESGRILLRFGFEFNGDWFTWSGEPDLFRRAWRRVHAIFASEGADRVEWVFSPNVVSVPPTPGNDMHRYWPGSDVVDWVGVDGYNFGDEHDAWHRWQTFGEIFGAVLDELERRYPDKPIMIAEFACAHGPDALRARWIRDAWAELRRRPRVRAAIWFDLDKRREGEPNWRIDATPGSLAAFNETFARP